MYDADDIFNTFPASWRINIATMLLALFGTRNSNRKYFKLPPPPPPHFSAAFNKNPVRAQKWIIRFYWVKSSRWKTWTCCSPSSLDPFLRSSLRHCRNKLIGWAGSNTVPLFMEAECDDKAKKKWSNAKLDTRSRHIRLKHLKLIISSWKLKKHREIYW